MIDFSQMILRLILALILGVIIGFERELVGKEAGIRTAMMVSSGAAIFTIIGISLPYLVATSPDNLTEVIGRNSGFLTVIANIVIGIGFLGAGTIIKNENKVHGLTTAAVIWTAAAIGTLAGLGLNAFAISSTILISSILYAFRTFGVRQVRGKKA